MSVPNTFAGRFGFVSALELDENFAALDIHSLVGRGGVPDDSTNNNAPINAAAGERTFLQPGIFKSSLAATLIPGPFWGVGQIRDSNNKLRAPWFTHMTAAAGAQEPFNLEDWWSGDISNVQIAMEHRVTGADTLGTEPTGYNVRYEAAPVVVSIYSESGHVENPDSSGGDGRSALPAVVISTFQNGTGDLIGINFEAFQAVANGAATSVLGQPNTILQNGNLIGNVDGSYLNVGEFRIDDNGFMALGTGWVMSMVRGNLGASGVAGDAFWTGSRVQSVGTEPIDAAFSGAGEMRMGLDLSSITTIVGGTWDRAAIVLRAGDRIYYDASDPGSPPFFCQDTGDVWTGLLSAGVFGISVDGNVSLQIEDGRVIVDDAFLAFSGSGGVNTGTSTATFTATNKPGATSGGGATPVTWMKVERPGGSVGWVPVFPD